MGNEASKGGSGPASARSAHQGGAAKAEIKPERDIYDMKIVFRGARRTGKTTLSARLQGRNPFAPPPAGLGGAYVPSPEIDTAFIRWAYKSSDDKIKVEIWDAVDHTLAEEAEVGKVDDDDAPAGAFRGG